MEELRGRWELPAIAHFISTFHGSFSLPELHVEELENAFLTSCTAEGSDLLNQLIASLLSGVYSSKNIEFYNYESPLRDYLHQKWVVECKKQNPLLNNEFKDTTLDEKTIIVYSLCMSRLDAEDVADATKTLGGEDMRVEPVGHDSQGCHFWNFNDERLYKEEPPPESEKSKKKKHKEKKKRKHKQRDSVESADEGEQTVQYGKWTLQCSTEEDWQTFVKQLKKSSHRQDKKLKKVIVNDFIPLIPEIIEEKEKAMKRRLLEMLPKRESNRLARRRAEIGEQKAIMAKLDAEDKEEARQRESEKKRLAEQRRKEEMAREREERIQAREEEKLTQAQSRQDRALRAVMREHKLATGVFNSTDDGSMSEESSEDTDWEQYNNTAGGTHVTLSHRQRSKRNRQIKPSTIPQFGPREYEKINRILYQLQRNANCWPFLEPVTRDIAPDYFDIIEKPMDISVLRRKSTRKEYSHKQQFIDDFNLIVANCTKYNGEHSEYGKMASNLKGKFDSLMEKSFHTDDAKPQRTKPSMEARQRVSYSEQLSDTSSQPSDSGKSNNNDSDSSDSYEQPKKTAASSHKRARGRPKGPPKQKTSTQNTASKGNSNKGNVSSSEDSSKSESDDPEEEPNQYNCTSNNPPVPAKSLSMSQSHQILMDASHAVSPDSKLLFGIARRTTPSNHSQSPQTMTPTHSVEKVSEMSNEGKKYVSLLSPNSGGAKVDKNVELARWMGKSPPQTPTISNGSLLRAAADNTTKLEPSSRPEQPFQGLFAQLKRSSVDTSPSGPVYKRVA